MKSNIRRTKLQFYLFSFFLGDERGYIMRYAVNRIWKDEQICILQETRIHKKGNPHEINSSCISVHGRVTGGFSRVVSEPRLLAKPRPFTNLPPEAVSSAEGLIIHVMSTPHHKESATAATRRIFRISVPYGRYPAPVTVNYRSSSVINCLLDRRDLFAAASVGS